MYTPSIFSNNFFDDFMNFSFPDVEKTLYGKHAAHMMSTDLKETENGYEMSIDLPGFKKEEVTAHLKDGYLIVSAEKGLDKDEKAPEGKYIRQERYTGACSRSFYVGTDLQPKDVSAKFTDGILELTVPKEAPKKEPDVTRVEIGE